MQRKVFLEYVTWHLSNIHPERMDYPKAQTDLYVNEWLDRDNLTEFVYFLEDILGEDLVFQGYNWRNLNTPEKIWSQLNQSFVFENDEKNEVRSTVS